MSLTVPSLRRRVAGLALGAVAACVALPVLANPYACQRYRAELANLNDGGATTSPFCAP